MNYEFAQQVLEAGTLCCAFPPLHVDVLHAVCWAWQRLLTTRLRHGAVPTQVSRSPNLAGVESLTHASYSSTATLSDGLTRKAGSHTSDTVRDSAGFVVLCADAAGVYTFTSPAVTSQCLLLRLWMCEPGKPHQCFAALPNHMATMNRAPFLW